MSNDSRNGEDDSTDDDDVNGDNSRGFFNEKDVNVEVEVMRRRPIAMLKAVVKTMIMLMTLEIIKTVDL